MPVPKKRHSNTRTNKRRANWKLYPAYSGICPQCGSPILPFYACKNCGSYKGRTVLKIKIKGSKAAKEGQQHKEAPKEKKEDKK